MFAEEFLPVHDVSDEVATVVAADPPAVWEALLDADLIEVGAHLGPRAAGAGPRDSRTFPDRDREQAG